MPSYDVNAATRLAEASWRREKCAECAGTKKLKKHSKNSTVGIN